MSFLCRFSSVALLQTCHMLQACHIPINKQRFTFTVNTPCHVLPGRFRLAITIFVSNDSRSNMIHFQFISNCLENSWPFFRKRHVAVVVVLLLCRRVVMSCVVVLCDGIVESVTPVRRSVY